MPNKTHQIAKQAVLDAGVLQAGHFVFADGHHAVHKLEMDNLWKNTESLEIVLGLLAQADGLPVADVILGVPRGGQLLAEDLANDNYTGLPIALLERVPGGKKQDFRFVTSADERLALGARSVRIYEDVVTTLSSIAGVVKLLEPAKQDIHALSIWRRGLVKDIYAKGVTDHYLVEELMPNYEVVDCPDPNCPAKLK